MTLASQGIFFSNKPHSSALIVMLSLSNEWVWQLYDVSKSLLQFSQENWSHERQNTVKFLWGKVGAAKNWKSSDVVGVNCSQIVKRRARWEAHIFPGFLTLQRWGFPILLLSLPSFFTTVPCSCSGRRWNTSKGQTSAAPPIWPQLTHYKAQNNISVVRNWELFTIMSPPLTKHSQGQNIFNSSLSPMNQCPRNCIKGFSDLT